jgi:uncharacterized DUF497 family protein
MFDLARIVGFDWDDANLQKSKEKHDVSQQESEEVFLDPDLRLAKDVKHSDLEERFQVLGKTRDGRLLHVTFTLREDGTRIRVISARPMNRKERTIYEMEDEQEA